MKRFICALLLICMVFVACDMGNNGNLGNNGFFSISNRNMDIKSLYISNIPVNNGGRAVSGSTIQTLSFINNLGQNTPFFFVSPSGKNIVLNVSEVQQLDNKRITANFSSYYEITEKDNVFTIGEMVSVGDGLNVWKTALIDFESGKVYDFSNWVIYIIKDDIIIASGRDYTIYKIDFNNISVATPLNNRTYYSMSSIYPPVLFDNKVIGEDDYVIDINNAFPIKKIQNAYITNEMCSFVNVPYEINFLFGSSTGLLFQDLSGNAYFFITGGKMPQMNNYNFGEPEKYFYGKITINDNAEVVLTDSIEGSFSFTPSNESNNIFFMNSADGGMKGSIGYSPFYTTNYFIIIYDNGFVSIKGKATGLQIESTALTMPSNSSLAQQKSFIKDNYLYYLETTSIKRLYLASGESAETLYTNNKLITNTGNIMNLLSVSGNNLIFYQFADDNISVNTYSLATYQHNAEPELLSSVSADIRNIVELDF